MNIEYKAPTIELNDEIRSYVEEKLAMVTKLLHDFADENISVEVELTQKAGQQTGDIFRTDLTMHAGANRTHAVGHGESLHASIDQAKDELTRRMRRGKNKHMDAVRNGGAKIKKMLRFWE